MKDDVAHQARITYRDDQGNSISEDFEVLNTSYTSYTTTDPKNHKESRRYLLYRHKKTGVIYSL